METIDYRFLIQDMGDRNVDLLLPFEEEIKRRGDGEAFRIKKKKWETRLSSQSWQSLNLVDIRMRRAQEID